MPEEVEFRNEEERLKCENDFLKMKIMIEHGGEFYSETKDNLPARVEHAFLNHIAEFEQQLASAGKIKIFEKIGSPQHFRSVDEIPDSEIGSAWEQLSNFMFDRGVNLIACS